MVCYIGKATKIFFTLVGVLLVVGLVVSFGLLRHGWAHKAAAQPCEASDDAECLPRAIPDPMPTDATAIPAMPIPTDIPGGANGTVTVGTPPPDVTATPVPAGAADAPSGNATLTTTTTTTPPSGVTAAPPLSTTSPSPPSPVALGPAQA